MIDNPKTTTTIKTPFQQKVLDVVRKIPSGQTLTYKEVAQMTGHPKAFRAVGNILNKNYDPTIPCHRVIRADGKLGGYNRVLAAKTELLRKEKPAPRKF